MPGPLTDVEQSCGSKNLQFSSKSPLIGRYNPENCRLSGLQDVFKYSFEEFRAVLFDIKAQIAIKNITLVLAVAAIAEVGVLETVEVLQAKEEKGDRGNPGLAGRRSAAPALARLS